jgi:hypothetical protein
MRVRHVFAIATLALLLAACSESVTGPSAPELRAAPDRPAYSGGGWMGGSGRTPDA